MADKEIPRVIMVLRPVDGGKFMVGLIECPNCGETNYTANTNCGEMWVYCGKSTKDNGWTKVMVSGVL